MAAKRDVTQRLLSKAATGIQGFDEISRGGLPRNRTSLVMGGPGAGKTVFALQALVNAFTRAQAARYLCRLRGRPRPDLRQRRDVRLGAAHAGP